MSIKVQPEPSLKVSAQSLPLDGGARLGAGFWLLIAGLLLVYVALTSVQPELVLTSTYDDQLFFNQAVSIVNGQWLGPYTHITLIKGPGYPLFLAFCHVLGLPVLLTERLLWGLFCVVFILSLRPLMRRRLILLGIYILLLFNPGTFDAPHATRIYRDSIYPALTGLIIACSFALLVRRRWSFQRLLPWSIGLGACLAIFWLTREEGMWIMPSVSLLLIPIAIAAIRERNRECWRPIVAGILPFLIWGGALLCVSLLNHHYYGFFGVVESKAKPFEEAYGALVRVTPAHEDRYIPVPREARMRIYQVSPAFAKLKPFLEGTVGADWQNTSEVFEHRSHGDMAGGWFIFALREAVLDAGYDHNPKQEMNFYRTLARQVNAACDSGKLAAGPRRRGIGPRIDRVSLPWIWDSFKNATVWTLTIPDYRSDVGPSPASTELIDECQDFTGSPVQIADQTSVHGWAFSPKWGPVTLSLKTLDGSLVPTTVDKPVEDGIYQYFLARGHDWPSAHNARFSIGTSDPRPCQLVVRAGMRDLGTFSLNPPAGYREDPDLCMAIDSVDRGNPAENGRADQVRYHSLDAIAAVYRHALPWLFSLAVLAVAAGFVAFVLGRRDPLLLLAISVLGAFIARLGIAALLDATSFPAISLAYLASAYPPLLMLIGAALAQPFSSGAFKQQIPSPEE